MREIPEKSQSRAEAGGGKPTHRIDGGMTFVVCSKRNYNRRWEEAS
jgi:hypothetical protein